MVRERESLWKMSHKEYKNRMIAYSLWEQIATNLPGDFSVDEVKDKWKKLRESYTKSKAYIPSGSAASSSKKQHKFCHQMKFIDDVIKHRQ